MDINIKQAIEVIGKVKKNFNVNSLYYKDLRIWPWIRMVLINEIEFPQIACDRRKRSKEKPYYYILPDPQQLAGLAQYRNVDYLFFTHHLEHTVRINGKYCNPWLEQYRLYFLDLLSQIQPVLL